MRSVILAAILVLGGSAAAQTIADERKALERAQKDAAATMLRSRNYEKAAAKARNQADKIRADAATLAAQVQESEAAIAAAQARAALIEQLYRRQQARLAARQQPIVRLTAALQTMSRRPPALVLLQPGSLDDMVHVRLLLGNAIPVIRARSADVRREVRRAGELRSAAASAVARVKQEQQMLVARRQSLARLEAAQRAQSRTFGDSAFLEKERAQGLAEKARDIVDLMASMDLQAETAADLASLSGPLLRPPRPGESVRPPPDRPAETKSRPAYRLPVLGRVVTGMGELSETGIRSRGLTMITRPDAQVIAPASGIVKFADSFRDYGKIVIIDHGGGWTSLITGLRIASVAAGDKVLQGSPIGRTERGKPEVTVELRREGIPIDIAPLAARG
ncbi:MAG: murein hydrolase activator EnvC [Sphingomonadaceae bacterium]